MSDPTTISTDQIRAAYDALGLDPERFDSTRTILLHSDGIQVVRYVPDAGGSFVFAEGLNALLTEGLAVPLTEESPAPEETETEYLQGREDAEMAEHQAQLEREEPAPVDLVPLPAAYDDQPAESPANARWIP